MSNLARRFQASMSLQARRDQLSYLEQEPMLPTPYRWLESNPKQIEVWDLDDDSHRETYLSFLLVYGYNEVPIVNVDSYVESLNKLLKIREDLWGDDFLPMSYDFVYEVSRIIGFKWEYSTHESILNFVNFLNKFDERRLPEKWRIKADWDHFSGTKLKFSYQLIEESKLLTKKQNPKLRRYSFNPINIAKDSVKGKLDNFPLLGIELEFTTPMVSLYDLLAVLSIGVFKNDSTTDVEFVSVPLEYQELCNYIKEYKEVFDIMLSANGIESNGMHVHASRKFISLAQEARIYYLINAGANRRYWQKVADRDVTNNSYCTFSSLSRNLISCVNTGDYSTLSDSDFPNTRHIAVNRKKGHTLEFRFFKSPSTAQKVLDNLLVVQSILDYTRAGGYTLPGYIKFLENYN